MLGLFCVVILLIFVTLVGLGAEVVYRSCSKDRAKARKEAEEKAGREAKQAECKAQWEALRARMKADSDAQTARWKTEWDAKTKVEKATAVVGNTALGIGVVATSPLYVFYWIGRAVSSD